jgi:hypothetical protein
MRMLAEPDAFPRESPHFGALWDLDLGSIGAQTVIAVRSFLLSMAVSLRKEGLNGFLQIVSAELPVLHRLYEPLRVGLMIGR